MKKILIVLLSLIMIFGLVACDEDDQLIVIEDEPLTFSQKLENLINEGVTKAEINEDSALWAVAKSSDNNLYGYVDEYGNWAIDPVFNETKDRTNGYGIVLDSSSFYTYVDASKNAAFVYCDGYRLSESNHFSDGMLVAALNSSFDQKYVYVNESFQRVISADNLPCVSWRYYYYSSWFAYASSFNNGLAVVMRLKNSSVYDGLGWESAYVIDKSGNITATLPAGLDPGVAGIDDNGNIIVSDRENKFGLCNSNGELIIECKYRFIKHCEGCLYLVCDDNGFYGFVDENGNTVIDFIYQKAYPFSCGVAAVSIDGKWGFINEIGETVIDFMFDDVAALYSANQDDSLNKAVFSDKMAAVYYEGNWVIINTDGDPVHVITEGECSGFDFCPYSAIKNGYICFAKSANGTPFYGAANYLGEQVIDPQFAYLGSFN